MERLCDCVLCGRLQDRPPSVPDYQVVCADCADALLSALTGYSTA